jgi:doublesex- and mab-3-related transcription factor 4/5
MDSLPPGKIFGINVTEPLTEPKIDKELKNSTSSEDNHKSSNESLPKGSSTSSKSPNISQNAIEMLSSLFPHRKRSVLELVLRRCDLDLLR